MIKEVDKIYKLFFIVAIVCFLKQSAFSKSFFGDVNISATVDDNVYNDSRQYSDLGYGIELGFGMRSRFSKYTSSMVQYLLSLNNFSKYNLEGATSHLFDGKIKQRLGDSFDLELNGGFNLSQMPSAGVYNSNRLYAFPSVKWHIFDRTTLTGGHIHEKTTYSDYNLDNETIGIQLKLGQELSLYTYIEISGIAQNKTYPERYLYDGISGGSPTYKTDTRKDTENFAGLTLSQNLTAKSGFELSYYLGKLESNENFFDWGPNQYEGNNTIPDDERIIADYRSYTSSKYGVNFFTGFIEDSKLFLSGSHTTKDYSGRLAKDENDTIRQPDKKRQDRQTLASVSWSKDILLVKYSYEINNSNDALYSYTNNTLSLSIRYSF